MGLGLSQQILRKKERMSEDLFLANLIGRWSGNCRTWFEPTQLADESPITSEFEWFLGRHFLKHSYRGTMQGKPRQGQELLVWNKVTNQYEVSWVDDFHMNYAIMVSSGSLGPQGLNVRGSYEVGPGQPAWGWRTIYQLSGTDELTIRAYNITPQGEETLAVETKYRRD